MAEIDPVILELRAEMGRFRAELKNSTDQTSRNFARMERDTQRLEKQMLKSSTAIAGSFRTLAGTLGTVFTGRELVGLLDSFTRLENSLKVAGLEGQKLESVQASLLDLSTRYGVGIEGLANLYGKATDAGRSFGASEEQVLQLTEATSQALLITGTSATQAQGAILGLSQALASGTVRAEEYNQINEGGLRPLLQAAAASQRFGGDINKLRAAMLDGKVSSQEFFNSILAGSQQLEGQASKAALTLSGAFEGLTSRLTVYVGEAAKTSGATEALALAMQKLADNLDTIIPLLAIIGAAFAGRFVAGALAGGTALRTLAAYASIATTSLAGTALAARSAGAALLAALGGPVGIAITALIIGLALASQEVDKLAGVSQHLRNTHDQVSASATKTASVIDRLATSYGKARQEALALAEAQRKLLIAESLKATQQQAAAFKVLKDAQDSANGGRGAQGGTNFAIDAARRDLRTAEDNAATAYKNLRDLERAMAAPPITSSSPVASGAKKSTRSGGAPTNDRTDELAARAAQDLFQLQIEELRAKAQITNDIEERADLERQILAMERDAREADIAAAVKSGDLTEKQAQAQREILDKLYGKREAENADGDILVQATKSLYGIAIERERRLQAERDRADIAETQYRGEADALRNQFDLATTLDERRAIALKILEAEDAYLRSKLEAVIANQDLTEAVRQQAQIELNALNASAGDRRKLVEKANQGALSRYIEDIGDTKARAEEAVVRELQAVNDGITDALSSALGVKNQFVKDLFSIFLDQVIFQPLAQALQDGGSGGGIGGFFSSIFGSIFGRASGGYVGPGQMIRVNEGASPGRVEGFVPTGSGNIIPLGQMNTRVSSGAPTNGTVKLVIEEAPGFAARVRTEAQGVAIDVQRQAAPALINASANEAMKRTAKAQRYGS